MTTMCTSVESLFAQFMEDKVHNGEQSSCGGSVSNSDAEPELQDSDFDDVDDVPDTKDAILQERQTLYERNWQHNAPKYNNVAVHALSNKQSLTTKSENVEKMDECFNLFISEKIVDIVLLYTNKKATESMPAGKIWKPIDRVELDAFIGILLLTGRFREADECKNYLWRQDEAYCRRIYAAVMSRERFTDILRYIRFDDPATRQERESYDKLAPLREITNTFVQNCKDSYNATDMGCIDEQFVTFYGCCSFKVSVPRNHGRCGIKVFTLCDSNTFYCCNMDVYLGKHKSVSKRRHGQCVIKQLTDFWKNSGKCITTNELFTDPKLAEELLENKIFLVGTVHKNKTDLPKLLTETQSRYQYSSEFLFTQQLTLVSYIPQKYKCDIVLSTLHHEDCISTAAEKYRPEILNYYNSTKHGVAALSEILKQYSCRRPTKRWPLSLFMHYIDIAAYNAFVIWVTKYPLWRNKSSLQGRRKQFLEDLSKALVAKNIDRRATKFENQEIGLHRSIISAIEATGRIVVKNPGKAGQKRARCCYCIGGDNKYSSVCDYCRRHVCYTHSTQTRSVMCYICKNVNAGEYVSVKYQPESEMTSAQNSELLQSVASEG